MYSLYLDGFLDLLQDLMGFIFEMQMQPMLIITFDIVLGLLVPFIKELFAGILYGILAAFLGLIDFLEQAFNVLSGVSTVTYTGDATDKQVYLLSFFVEHDVIQRALMMFTAFGVALSFIFAIYGALKGISNSVVNEREFRPVGKVLKSWGRGALNFLLIPIMVIMAVKISTLVLVQISNSIQNGQGGASTTLGTIIFLANSMNATKTEDGAPKQRSYSRRGAIVAKKIFGTNLPSTKAFINSPGVFDSLRIDYYIGIKDYKSVSQVQEDFDLSEYNFVEAFICAIFVFLVLATSLLSFVRVIIEVLILYIAAPLTIATFPMDDGRMFDEWKGTFLSRMIYNYGMVFSMKLFMTLVPTIMSPNLVFFDSNQPTSLGYSGIFDGLLSNMQSSTDQNFQPLIDLLGASTVDYLIRLLIILGGAYSVFHAQHLILEIVSEPVAAGAKGTSASGAAAIKKVAMSAVSGAAGAMSKMGAAKNAGAKGGGGGDGGGGGNMNEGLKKIAQQAQEKPQEKSKEKVKEEQPKPYRQNGKGGYS